MKEKLTRRLEELKSELKSGQRMETELQGQLAQFRTPLLRISGAIQAIEELLDGEAAGADGSPGTSGVTPHRQSLRRMGRNDAET